MARKLYGAALAAHRAKVGRRNRPSRKARRVVRRRTRRNMPPDPKGIGHKKVSLRTGARRYRHYVKQYARKGGKVKSYRRKRTPRVGGHWSNPRRRYRRNPSFGLMQGLPGMAIDLLVGAAVVLVGLAVANMVNRQVEKFPVMATGWANILAKTGVALGLTSLAYYMAQTEKQRQFAQAASMGMALPAFAGAITLALPQVAGYLVPQNMAPASSLMAQLNAQLNRELATAPGPRLSDYTIDAERAGMETDASMF